MTKEELKQEVEKKGVEYADKQKRTISVHEDSGYSWGQVEEAYEQGALDFAKSREKRIAELELKIEKLTQHLEPQSMTALFEQVEEEVKQKQRIAELEGALAEQKQYTEFKCYEFKQKREELEKENAEYKEVFGDCDTCKRTCDIGNCCNSGTKSGYLLDKAKVIIKRQEIIRDQKELLDSVLSGAETLSNFAQNTLRKAEQFLNEVEK